MASTLQCPQLLKPARTATKSLPALVVIKTLLTGPSPLPNNPLRLLAECSPLPSAIVRLLRQEWGSRAPLSDGGELQTKVLVEPLLLTYLSMLSCGQMTGTTTTSTQAISL